MPTKLNLPANAKLVPLKKGETCSLKRHFKGCTRQVIAYLDLLASKDPDRVVWMRVDNIVEHCKNYSKKDKAGKPTLYKKSMVEKALKELRDTGILSYPAKVPQHVRRGFVVTDCFVLAPHEALTVREEESCRMVGPGRVPGTSWAATSKNMWYVAKDRKNLLKSTVIFTVGITDPITDGITVPITDPITDGITDSLEKKEPEHYGADYGDKSGDALETTNDSPQAEKVFQEFSAAEPAPRLGRLLDAETHTPPNPPKPATTAPNSEERGVACVSASNPSTKEVKTPLADKDPGPQPTAKPSPMVETELAPRAAARPTPEQQETIDWMKRRFRKSEDRACRTTKAHEAELLALLRSYGNKAIRLGWWHYVKETTFNLKGHDTIYPLAGFLLEAEDHINAAIRKIHKQGNDHLSVYPDERAESLERLRDANLLYGLKKNLRVYGIPCFHPDFKPTLTADDKEYIAFVDSRVKSNATEEEIYSTTLRGATTYVGLEARHKKFLDDVPDEVIPEGVELQEEPKPE